MDAASIAKALENKKAGSFFSVKMRKLAKTFKGVAEVVEKESIMTGQLCDYSARFAVKNAVAEGERDAPELPSHIKNSFTVGSVRFWQGKNGSVYLPMPLAGNKTKVQWYLGGNPVEYSEVEPLLTSADKPKERKDRDELAEIGQVPFVGINVENILEIH
jgi:hypothetical protein